LTSSQSHRWNETEVSVHDIHGVFKRPHLSAFEMNLSVHRQSAAACVSLSKSTMSKTRTTSAIPPFSAQCRRRRLSIQPRIPCQTISRRNPSTFSAVQPGGFLRSRQLLKKPSEPVKHLFQKKEKLIWSEILGSSRELLCISWRAASNEAELPGQPTFSLLFSWRPRPPQSAKGDQGAPLGAP
jgi:hypothetical protein